MKKRLAAAFLVVLLVTCTLNLTPSTAETAKTFEKVDFISGVVTANRLNLRNGPSMDSEVIAVFNKNKWLNVLAQIGDWYAVFDPDTGKVGCVYKAYLANPETLKHSNPSVKTPTTTTPKPTPAPSVPAPSTPAPTTTPAPGTTDLSANEKLLIDLINQERAKANLAPLQADTELMKVARIKCKDMADNNYFSHYSPTYGSPFDMMRQFGITFKSAAENIAGNSTVQGAVTAWMKSEGHRQNIMNSSYTHTGVGIVESKKYGYLFVQMFIRK